MEQKETIAKLEKRVEMLETMNKLLVTALEEQHNKIEVLEGHYVGHGKEGA